MDLMCSQNQRKITKNRLTIEVKSAETLNNEFFKNLDYIQKLFPRQIRDRAIVYGGNKTYEMNKTKILNLENLNGYLETLL